MLERLKIWWELVPLAWGRFVQPAHGWRILLRWARWSWLLGSSTGLTISSHGEGRRVCARNLLRDKTVAERRYSDWTKNPLMRPSEIFLLFSALSFKEWKLIQKHLSHEQYVWGLRKFLMGCRTCHLCASSSDVVQILVGSMLITSDNTLMAFMLFQLVPGGDAPTSQKHSQIMNANSTRGGKGWDSSWEESLQSPLLPGSQHTLWS